MDNSFEQQESPNIPGFRLVASGEESSVKPSKSNGNDSDAASLDGNDVKNVLLPRENEDDRVRIFDATGSDSLPSSQPRLIQDLREMARETSLITDFITDGPISLSQEEQQLKMIEQLQLEQAINDSMLQTLEEDAALERALRQSTMDVVDEDAQLLAAIEASQQQARKEAQIDEDYVQASKRLMAQRMDSMGGDMMTEAAGGAGADEDQTSVLVDMVEGDPSLIDIEKDFYKANLRVTKVQKIENDYLWNLFRGEVDLMRDHRKDKEPGYALNMRGLYHGTKAPLEQIVEEGLDNRLSRKGHFGRGIYFSDDPRKCLQYTEAQGPRFVLRCRVLLGDIKEFPDGESNVSLIREPYKKTYKGQKIYYDSVCGKPRDFMEYVVYERRRVLLEHVVYYEEKETSRNQANQRQKCPRSLYDEDETVPKQRLNRNASSATSSMSAHESAPSCATGPNDDENDDFGLSGSVRRKQPKLSVVSPKHTNHIEHMSQQTGVVGKADTNILHNNISAQSVKRTNKSKKKRLVDSDSDSEDDIPVFDNSYRTSRGRNESGRYDFDRNDKNLRGRRSSLDRSESEGDDRGRRSSIEREVRGRRSSIEREVRPRRSSVERESTGRRSSMEWNSASWNNVTDNALPRTNIEIPDSGGRQNVNNDDEDDEDDDGNSNPNNEIDNMTEDDINIVTENLLTDFLMVTELNREMHYEESIRYIRLANYDLQRAIQLYYDDQ